MEQYILEAVEANPLLEFPGEGMAPDWRETAGEQGRNRTVRDREDDPLPDPVANAGRQEKTLQAGGGGTGGVSAAFRSRTAPGLLHGRDSGQRGWWTESIPDTARAFGVTEETVLKVLGLIQQLEPAGVGARDLSQCLLLQLENQGKEADLARKIIREGLDLLGQNQIPALARKFRCTQEEVLKARERIRALDPKPGSRYAAPGPVAYQREDLWVEDTGTGLQVTVHDPGGGNSS